MKGLLLFPNDYPYSGLSKYFQLMYQLPLSIQMEQWLEVELPFP
jgi:hypothetical protein